GLPLTHKQGSVFVVTGAEPLPVSGAKDMIALLEAGKKRRAYPDARGGFKVTQALHVVLKRGTLPSDPGNTKWLALGRLTAAPTWEGQGEDAAAAPANSAAPREDVGTKPPKPPAAPGKAGKEPWFVLVQEGFLAATQDDAATLNHVVERLRSASKAWAYDAMSALAKGTELPAGSNEKPPSSLDTLLPFVARAYASGRTDLVERAAKGFNVGKGQKDKRVAVHNALAILAGRTQQIWRPE
ncbi:hypothetical protein OAX78_04590, partial [Planctomycetota bacterium]|nr:hypothetical protein [Planctomycetota bacterium]